MEEVYTYRRHANLGRQQEPQIEIQCHGLCVHIRLESSVWRMLGGGRFDFFEAELLLRLTRCLARPSKPTFDAYRSHSPAGPSGWYVLCCILRRTKLAQRVRAFFGRMFGALSDLSDLACPMIDVDEAAKMVLVT